MNLTILKNILAFLMLPKIVEKIIIRLFDFLSQQKFYFTTSCAYSLTLEVNYKKIFGSSCPNLTTAMLLLLLPHGAEQLTKKPHERCPKHWIDSSRKFQNYLRTQGNKINLNDDYNKDTFIIASLIIVLNKNISIYIYSNKIHESPNPNF